jgi:uncharacterized protein HemX
VNAKAAVGGGRIPVARSRFRAFRGRSRPEGGAGGENVLASAPTVGLALALWEVTQGRELRMAAKKKATKKKKKATRKKKKVARKKKKIGKKIARKKKKFGKKIARRKKKKAARKKKKAKKKAKKKISKKR